MQHSECTGTNVVLPHGSVAARAAFLGSAIEATLVLQDISGGSLTVGTAVEVVQHAEGATRAHLVQCSAAGAPARLGNSKEVALSIATQSPQKRISSVAAGIKAVKNSLRTTTAHFPDRPVTVSSALL